MKSILVCSLSLISFLPLQAQDQEQGQRPIENQFDQLLEKSNDYQGYKVVDYNELISLKENTLSYISELRDKITTRENLTREQQEEIAELKAELEATQNRLQIIEAEKEVIRFLGIPLNKQDYKSLVWGIIALLAVVLGFFVFRYRKADTKIAEVKEKLSQTEKEFEVYRAKALEKEQRLGRQLQDERNKASGK